MPAVWGGVLLPARPLPPSQEPEAHGGRAETGAAAPRLNTPSHWCESLSPSCVNTPWTRCETFMCPLWLSLQYRKENVFMFLMTVQIPLLQPVDWMCQYLVQLSLQYGKWSSHFFLDSYMGWGNPLVWTVHQLDMECVHILLDIFAAVQRERDFLLRGSCKDWNCLQKEKVLFCRTAWVSVSLWIHHQRDIKVYMSAQLCCNGM